MHSKTIHEAVVTIQAGRIPRLDFYGRADPYVRIYVNTIKGKKQVTVPTTCKTTTKKNAIQPVWDETFAVPVISEIDILIFKVFDSRDHLVDGLIGLCMLPVSKLDDSEEIWRGRLEIFNPAKATKAGKVDSVGTLDVAAKKVAIELSLLEKEDLLSVEKRRRGLKSLDSRFLGIGELAAFFLEEGFSNDIDANWDHAVQILSEQRAYRIWEETDCADDAKNLNEARADVLKEGGLWDGF